MPDIEVYSKLPRHTFVAIYIPAYNGLTRPSPRSVNGVGYNINVYYYP